MSDTALRQGNSQVKAIGYLSEKNLEKAVDDHGTAIIRGNLVIQTGEANSVSFRVYVPERWSDRKGGWKDNVAWAGINTVYDNFESIADVGKEKATIVRVSNGDYTPNTYISRNGQTVEGLPQYKSSFFSHDDRGENFESKFKAQMDIEVYISEIHPEVKLIGDTETETGRLICNTWFNTYNGLEKVQFIVPEDIASEFEAAVLPGQTREFYVDIVNTENVQVIEKKAAIGRGNVEERISRTRELIVTGVSDDYATSDAPELHEKVFSEEAIQAAIHEYHNRIEEMKNKANEDSPVQKAAAASEPAKW